MPNLIAAGTNYPVQAILFDKDGTLLDFVYMWGNWSEHMFARFYSELDDQRLACSILGTHPYGELIRMRKAR